MRIGKRAGGPDRGDRVAISTNFAAGVAKPLLELRYVDVTIGVWPIANVAA